ETQGQGTDASAKARQGAQGLQGKAEEEAGRVRIAGQEEVREQGQGKEYPPREEYPSEGQVTPAANRHAGRRGRALLVAALAVGATWLSVPPALAAPSWSVKMAHANPYGQHA